MSTVQDGDGWEELRDYVEQLGKNSFSHISSGYTAGQDMSEVLTCLRNLISSSWGPSNASCSQSVQCTVHNGPNDKGKCTLI